MKKLILQNNLVPQLLLYVGLTLIIWPTALRILGVVNFGNDISPAFLYMGIGVMLLGGALQAYQKQQARESFFKGYGFRLLVGIAVVAIMMLAGIIKTPALLQSLF